MTIHFRRRELLAALGGAAAWPMVARAQQSAMPVIGFVHPSSPDAFPDRLRAFHRGLKDTGCVEGESVAVVYRWAEDRNDQLPELAVELVHRQVNVITAFASAALATKAVTTTIPVVFLVIEDPVRLDLVASLARPGGNATGIKLSVES